MSKNHDWGLLSPRVGPVDRLEREEDDFLWARVPRSAAAMERVGEALIEGGAKRRRGADLSSLLLLEARVGERPAAAGADRGV